ncbi:MAG: peptidoglycan bridge formation glycyltransferase FemA/FemB family protein [Oscillospiraceae bacterium]
MRFIQAVNEQKFDAFVRRHPTKSHFMQSPAWGEFCRIEKGQTPYLVGMEDESGSLCAAALLLYRQPVRFISYMYCPRGYVLDYNDGELLGEFSKCVETFAKEKGCAFVKIDPDIERRSINSNGEKAEGFDNQAVIDRLVELGYKHRGFNLGFEGREPRFTFRIDLMRDKAEIGKAIVGNVMKNVRKSHNYAVTVRKGTSKDVAELYRLITITSERDEFFAPPLSYYQSMFNCLDKSDMATLFIGHVDPAKSVVMLENELDELRKKRETLKKPGPLEESKITEARLLREIAQFQKYAVDYPDGANISAHFVISYGDKAWAVHAGSDKLMSETFVNNRVYFEKIMDAKERGFKVLDQFGTVGNPQTSPLRGLHEFKAQFGGRYVEFIGEFDLVTRPLVYRLYTTLLPRYRSLRFGLKELARKLARKAG